MFLSRKNFLGIVPPSEVYGKQYPPKCRRSGYAGKHVGRKIDGRVAARSVLLEIEVENF